MAKRLLIIIGALIAISAAEPARSPALSMIQPGQWTFKSRQDAAENRSICVKDPRALIQMRHSGAACSRFVISNDPRQTTVHYTCPGSGHGRTTITVHTGKSIEVESQGIADKQPFALMLEGRRTGDCGAVTGLRTR